MLLNTERSKWIGLFGAIAALIILICISIVYGYTDTTWKAAFDAFTKFNGSTEHIVIQSIRLPRALIAGAIGASLAISGVMLQTLTKNPLASPDIFGVNAGAGVLVVAGVTLFNLQDMHAFTWISFLGAALATIAVFLVGSIGRGGMTPMKLTLAGAALSAMFASITQGLLVLNEAALEQVLFWLAGSVSGRDIENLQVVFPYLAAGWAGSLIVSGKMNILAMGDDVAKGLGLRVVYIKIAICFLIVLLAGGAVAVAGPIGFIGIVVPHLTRAIVGIDHRWVIPFSALLGAMLLLLADVASRYILMPQEVPVGIMTAMIGTPFFIYIARKGFNAR